MGLCTDLFLPQDDVGRESQSLHARINVYIKSYKAAAKAVSDVIQFHTEHDKLQQWKWPATNVGHLTRQLMTLSS